MKSANALAPQVAGMKKTMLRSSTWVTSAPWPRGRERKLDRFLWSRRPLGTFDLPARLEDDDRPVEGERQADLGALRALGWPASAVVRLLAAQAGFLGVCGGLAALAVVLSVGLLVRAPASATSWGLLTAAGMSIMTTAITLIAPLFHSYRANPADALRGE